MRKHLPEYSEMYKITSHSHSTGYIAHSSQIRDILIISSLPADLTELHRPLHGMRYYICCIPAWDDFDEIADEKPSY